ncbi:MAG: hypothetical protein AB1696_25055 [Planctomycetota bacterium]
MIQILAAVALILGAFLAGLNWYSILASRRQGRFVSPIPILGGGLLVLGLLGFERTRPYAALGILADYGTLGLFLAMPVILWEAWCTSSANLVHRFVSDRDGRRDDIRLFRRGRLAIDTRYDPPAQSNAQGALAVSRGFVGRWRAEGDGFVLEGYHEGRILRIREADGGYITTETGGPSDPEFDVYRLDGLRLEKVR